MIMPRAPWFGNLDSREAAGNQDMMNMGAPGWVLLRCPVTNVIEVRGQGVGEWLDLADALNQAALWQRMTPGADGVRCLALAINEQWVRWARNKEAESGS